MNKQELEAENRRLADEIEAHRELLAAVRELATVPRAADWSDVAYICNLESRLIMLRAYAMPLDDVGPEIMARVIRTRARTLRDEAAEPVKYEVKAAAPEPEAAAVPAAPAEAGTPVVPGEDRAVSA